MTSVPASGPKDIREKLREQTRPGPQLVGWTVAFAYLVLAAALGDGELETTTGVAMGIVVLVLVGWVVVERWSERPVAGEPWISDGAFLAILSSEDLPRDTAGDLGLRRRLERRIARLQADRRLVLPIFLGLALVSAVLTWPDGRPELLLSALLIVLGLVGRDLLTRRIDRHERLLARVSARRPPGASNSPTSFD